MTTITTTMGNFLILEIPESAHDISYCRSSADISFRYEGSAGLGQRTLELPKQYYDIICMTKTVTGEQAAKIVDPVQSPTPAPRKKDRTPYSSDFWQQSQAIHSLNCLLMENKLNPENNYCILKIEQDGER